MTPELAFSLNVAVKGESAADDAEFTIAYSDLPYNTFDFADNTHIEAGANGSIAIAFDGAPGVLQQLTLQPDAPRLALGWLVTAKTERPEMFFKTRGHGSAQCDEDAGVCTIETEFCLDSGECYREVSTCDADYDNCEEKGEGNPALGESPWDYIDAFSGSFAVLYLAQDVAEDSFVAEATGITEAGYHVLRVAEPPSGERNPTACDKEATRTAVERYNAKYDTKLSADELLHEGEIERQREFNRMDDAAYAELGCLLVKSKMEEVESTQELVAQMESLY